MSTNEQNLTEQTPEEENVSTDEVVTKTEKTFTEAEVQRMIKDRVGREKDAHRKTLETIEFEREEEHKTNTMWEGVVQKVVESMKANLPEEYTELLSKLSLSEQYEWLIKSDRKLAPKRQVPSSPPPSNNNQGSETKTEPPKQRKIF